MNFILGLLGMIGSIGMLILKYRVVLTGEKCKAKIIDIENKDCLYTIGGVKVKKHAYIVEINNNKYYTAHGCLFTSLGKKKIGRYMVVFKNEKYGKEVFKYLDFRIEIVAIILFLFSGLLFVYG